MKGFIFVFQFEKRTDTSPHAKDVEIGFLKPFAFQ